MAGASTLDASLCFHLGATEARGLHPASDSPGESTPSISLVSELLPEQEPPQKLTSQNVNTMASMSPF